MQVAEETLLEIGLGKNEAKVYLSLVGAKRSSVVDLATKSGVHRVNVYDALKTLLRLGLASFFNIGKKRYYRATRPETLLLLLKEKEEKVHSLIPVLDARYEKAENAAQIFEGLEGIKRILEDILYVGKAIKAFGIPRVMPELLGGYLQGFHRKRIQKNMRIQHIYNENARERIAYLNKIKYSEAKYLPPEYSVPATTVIYGNKTAFWIWSDVPFCVLIDSEKMANAYRTYFELLWKLAR